MDDSEFVKECRKEFGLSQNQLAKILGKKNPRTIRKWENGEGEIQRTDLISIALLMDFKMMDTELEKNPEYYEFFILQLFQSVEDRIKKSPA